MSTIVDLLSGEIERLFSTADMKALCVDYLNVDPAEAGIEDSTRSVFARKIVDYCSREDAIEALTDVVSTLKRGTTDPRLQQIYGKSILQNGFKPGAKVDGFIIEAPIEKDVLGQHYRCQGDVDEKTFKLLVLNERLCGEKRLVQRFVALMRLLKADEIPGIESVVKAGILSDGRGYVVTEWVDAPTLAEKPPLTIKGALSVFEILLNALGSLHQKGIYHGNISTHCVKVQGDDGAPEPIIEGFGVDRLIETGKIGMGIAPEEIRHHRVDARSDVYALGALLYELLVGEPPFKGNHIVDIVAHHVVDPVPDVSAKLDEPGASAFDKFVQTLMAKDPATRPRDIDVLRRKFEAVKRSFEQLQAQSANTGTREDIASAIEPFMDNPADEAVLRKLLEDGRAANAWGAVVEVLEEVGGALSDPALMRKLLLLAGNMAAKRLKNYDRSLAAYEQVLAVTPMDDETLQLLFDALESAGRYEDLIARMAAKVEGVTDPSERNDLLKRMASVYEKKLKDLSNAYSYYVACLTGTEADKELLGILEPLAEKTAQIENLAASVGEAASVSEQAGDVETTLFFYEHLADYYLNKLKQPAYALTCFQKIYELRPGDEGALKAISDLYREAQQWPELAQIMMQMAEAETQPAIRRSHMVEAAQIFHGRLQNSDQAYTLLDSVLSEDPGNKKALDIITEIIQASGDIQRLAKLLSDSLDAISDEKEQLAVRCRLGSIYENQLNDLAEAKRHYESALAVDSAFLDALKGLDRIYTKEGNAVALRNNLDTQLECPDITPKQKSDILQRLADLSEEEFKENDKAIMYLEALLETDETHRYAMVTLTRLYRRAQRWEDLVDLLEKRAKNASEDEKKSLLKERAEIIKDELKDANRAIEALTEVTSLGVDDALETLARTQEDAGNYTAAVATLQKIVAAAADVAVKQSVMVRIAMIEFEKLDSVDDAILTLRKARDINVNDRATLGLYAKVMVSKRNFAEALTAMEQEAALETGVGARAEILAQMGLVCMENLDDRERAVAYFKSATELEEGNFTASFNLLRIYKQLGRFEDAMPLYRRWKDAVDTINPEERIIFLEDMGDIYTADKRSDEAYKAYAKAISIEGVKISAGLLLKFAEAAFETDQTAGVAEQIQVFLDNSSDLEPEVRAAVQVALAKAYLSQNNLIEANKLLRHLLNTSPKNADARAILADVQEARGDFRQMVESLMEVISSLPAEDARRVEFMRRAAVTMFEKLRDSDGAVKLLKKALEVSDNDRTVLAELLKIHTASKNFNELVDVILKIADQVTEPSQKVRYYVSAAKVYRREIGNLKKAVQYFEMALEIDPTDKDANKAIVETLEQNMSWDKLEGHYKKLIARIPKEGPVEDKLAVYKPLFELLGKKLKKKADALVIGEAISKIAPDDLAHAEVLADMYGWDTKYADKSTVLHQRLLEKNATRAESVRQLYRIFSAKGSPDQTWCASSVLSLLNVCTPDELKYYKDYKPVDLQTFANVLDADHWHRKLLPKEMDKTITSIFAVVQHVIFQTKGQPLSRYGIDITQAVDVTQSQYPAAAYVNFAAGSLGIAPPPFFFLQGAQPGYSMLETNPPVLISDGNEAYLTDRVAMIFSLGQQLSLFYPGLVISKMIPSGTELLSWLLASIRLFAPQLPVPDDIAGAVTDKLTPLRSGLDDAAMERLQGHVHTFLATSSSEVNLKKWAKTVTFTQDRAGLILAGDLAVAVKIIREQEKDEKKLAERLRAITLFTLSNEHYELRSHLGSALRSA